MKIRMNKSKDNDFDQFVIALHQPALLLTDAGNVLIGNTAFLDLYGFTSSELTNQNLFDVCKKNNLPPPFVNMDMALHGYQNRTTVHTQTIQWSASVMNAGRYKDAILIIGFDITFFINASQQEENFKTSIIDQLPNHYIFWKDQNSVYLGCNAALASAFGFSSSAEIIGKTDYDLPTTKEQSDAYRADDRYVMETKTPKLNIEEQQTLGHGEIRVLSTSKTPILDEQGNVRGILAIYSDITDRKKMELSLEKAKNQAEAANLAKTEFIANMSHDIRTPLTGIVGISKLLEENAKNPNDKQYALWINESGNQLLSLLNGILDMVSADNISEIDLHEEAFNLHQCIQDIILLELPMIQLKNLELKTEIDRNVPPNIISDRTKIHRILLNLLGNAIKFTQEGHITIALKCLAADDQHAQIQFSVSDTGIGIPDELQDKVFDRFFRATPSYKGTYTGSGVGLHIAQSYVKLLGGEIVLFSQHGVGTTFSFNLSFKIANQHIVSSPTMTHYDYEFMTKPQLSYSPHILLIEDNAVALRMAEVMASKMGCRYRSAIDGEIGLELAKAIDFDLIITDIGLPGITGHEFTRRLRAIEVALNKRSVPIIGLTAHARDVAAKECLECGMNDVFTKPISLTMLQMLVNQFVSPPIDDKLHIPQVFGHLGFDLPDTEEQLFELDGFPLLDISSAIESIGNESLLPEIFLMVNQEILDDSKAIAKAYAEKNWGTVEKLAHKMKGGAVYSGTVRMKYACQFLERYHKAGYTSLLDKLYQQLMHVLCETKQAIEHWLRLGPEG